MTNVYITNPLIWNKNENKKECEFEGGPDDACAALQFYDFNGSNEKERYVV